MPTSDLRARVGGLALAGILLGGCLPEAAMLGATGPVPVAALRVAGDGVVVAGPPGYCVDSSTARERGEGSFVMLGRCAVLEGGAAEDAAAVLTAVISPPSELAQRPDGDQLARFFRSETGRAALAHDGAAASVTLLQVRPRGEVLYLKVRDNSEDRPDGLAPVSWRAVFALRDRLVALSAGHHEEMPVSEADLRRKLEAFVAAMRAANDDGAGAEDT